MHVNEYIPTVEQPDQTVPQPEQMPAQMPAPQPAAQTANDSTGSVPEFVFSNQHRHQPVAQREDSDTQLSRFFGKSTEVVRRPDQHTAQQGGPVETIFTQPPAAPVQWQGQTPHADGPPANAPRGPRQKRHQSGSVFGNRAEGSSGHGGGAGHGKRKRREVVVEGPGWDTDDERGELTKGGGHMGRKRR